MADKEAIEKRFSHLDNLMYPVIKTHTREERNNLVDSIMEFIDNTNYDDGSVVAFIKMSYYYKKLTGNTVACTDDKGDFITKETLIDDLFGNLLNAFDKK